ncbi:MAG TPA: hypothetical protein VIP48_01060 [Streptosporangiaceae bacterium]
MITAATLCPWPPLLVRELTGADPVVPELRDACAAAVADLLAGGPGLVAVVAPGSSTTTWPADGRLNVAAFGGLPPSSQSGICRPGADGSVPDIGSPAPGTGVQYERPALPPAAGMGAYLLDQAAYQGPRVIWTVSEDETPAGCRKLGAELAAADARTALLVLGDGSARRGPKAPGAFDERVAAFDADVERAIRAADLDALLAVDPALARDLMATGRPAWQVLAGALAGTDPAVQVRYADDPFGVMYLVASLMPSLR